MITSPSLANGLDDEVEPRAVELPEGGVFTRPEPIVGKGGVFTASRPEPEAAASCSSRGMVLKVTQWYSRSLSGTQGHSVVLEDTQWYSRSLSGTQGHSVVPKVTQWYSRSLRGSQGAIAPAAAVESFSPASHDRLRQRRARRPRSGRA